MSPKKIKECRMKMGYTQEELGELLNISATSIGHWERGQSKVPRHHRKRLSLALGVPYEKPRIIYKSKEQRERERSERVRITRRLDRKTDGKWQFLADDDEDLIELRKVVGAYD